MDALRRVWKEVRDDVATARDRDPAARDVSFLGILSSWGGVQAILAHRVAHAFHRNGWKLAPRIIVYATRALTGMRTSACSSRDSATPSRVSAACSSAACRSRPTRSALGRTTLLRGVSSCSSWSFSNSLLTYYSIY